MSDSTNRSRIRAVATTGMLLAVMLLFAFTPIGFIQIGPIAATLVHIPVIIGVLTEGLGTGIFLGVAFGVISMVRAFVAPTITSFLFMNPLIAIVPRVLIPLIAWAVRALMLRTFEKARFEARFGASAADAIGAFAGSLTNTVLVLSLIWLIYASRYAEALDIAQGGVAAALAATAVMNGLPEAVVAAVSVPAVSGALLLAKRRSAR